MICTLGRSSTLEKIDILFRTNDTHQLARRLAWLSDVTTYDENIISIVNQIKCSTFTKSGTYEMVMLGNRQTKKVSIHVAGEQLRIGKDIEIVVDTLMYQRRFYLFDWKVFAK